MTRFPCIAVASLARISSSSSAALSKVAITDQLGSHTYQDLSAGSAVVANRIKVTFTQTLYL